MAYDETYFSQARSINTLYCDKEGDSLSDVRLCLARFGEDERADNFRGSGGRYLGGRGAACKVGFARRAERSRHAIET